MNTTWWVVVAVTVAVAGIAVAQSTNQSLAIGAEAPAFAVPGTNDRTNRLEDFKGRWLVLYFYPKAFTPGCTSESCSLRDGHGELVKAGATVLGVSLDSVARLKEFKQSYNLPFDLLSDADKAMSRTYRTLGFGGLFAERRTFVINPDGRIAHVFEQVNVRSHDRQVAEVLQRLQAGTKADAAPPATPEAAAPVPAAPPSPKP